MRDRKDDTIHRKVTEAKLGRKLAPNEVVHHGDEDKTNNTPANLTPEDRGQHTTNHNKTRGLSRLRKALTMPKRGEKLY